MILGCDTSEFAGAPDYALLAERGARFAIPRASSGPEHVDKLVEKHLAGFASAGIWARAAYHYLYSWKDGAQQAEHAYRVARDLGLLTSFLDIEPVMDGTRPEDAPAIARLTAHAFARRWQELSGEPCDVYGPLAYLRLLNLDRSLFRHVWGAHVGQGGTPLVGPPMALPGFDILIHQYQHNAPAGVGVVDWNRTPLTLDQLDAVLGRRWTAPAEVLANVLRVSDAAMGTDGPERFVDREEGPRIP